MKSKRYIRLFIISFSFFIIALAIVNYPMVIIYLNKDMDTNPIPDNSGKYNSYTIKYVSNCRIGNPLFRLSAIDTLPIMLGKDGDRYLMKLLIRETNYWYSDNIINNYLRNINKMNIAAIPEINKLRYIYYNDDSALNYLIINTASSDHTIAIWSYYGLREICEKYTKDFCSEIDFNKMKSRIK